MDVACKVRQSYSLQDFPYDFQELVLTIRLNKDHRDPLIRYVVPVAHDKAFFCSSRVPELTEWEVRKQMDQYLKGIGRLAVISGLFRQQTNKQTNKQTNR